MKPLHILFLIVGYFSVLLIISFITGRKANNNTFFKANNSSPWYLVAFGMIGASLSGVTFISVPGWVENQSMSYMQMVFGYILGYAVIGLVLLPLYYRLNLTSIYTYLEDRFGRYSYKTGASFFLLSRTIGAAFRLFLVANVLQLLLFDEFGIPFWLTVTITILLIWLYTFKGGIKTIVWTDTLQTLFMLIAVGVCIYTISDEMNISNIFNYVSDSELSKTFFFEDYKAGNYFWKRFFSGAFIAIVMTGLDQDMMQKNLSCKNLKDAQKNMFWFTVILVVVNLLFLSLGVMLYLYAETKGITIPEKSDGLFPLLATEYFSPFAGIVFVLGIIAAAYSSVDSTLTALTTSFCYDFLQIERNYAPERRLFIRKIVHIGFTFLMFLLILAFYWLNDQSVINSVFILAGYTYGPLLGLFGFGLFTKHQVKDAWVPALAVLAPSLTFLITSNSQAWLWGYTFGFEALILNGGLMFVGLYLLRKKSKD